MTTPTSVEALAPGDHACLTFTDGEERLDIVAAFVRDGLGVGYKVVCITDSVGPDRLLREFTERGVALDEALRRGQIALHTSDESWLANGALTASKMVDVLADQLDLADREGFPGLRITADMCWATRPIAAVEQLVVFESEVGRLFSDGRLTAICQYDRQSFDAVTLAFAAKAHSRAVAATVYHEDPILRVCRQHTPPGLRLAGEIDYTNLDPLNQALGEALRIDTSIHVNLAQLRFIDAAAAGAILQAALAMRAGGQMIVVCRRAVHKVLELVGLTDVAHIRVVMVHGEP
ncbi:MAG TPA: MEDS domain-containing protein [Micromonosporaceae bacterium]|nr:MEDS domain-containing protein [Micromonosporaceae bacterium]